MLDRPVSLSWGEHWRDPVAGGDGGLSIFIKYSRAFSRRVAPELCWYFPPGRAWRYPEKAAGAAPSGERALP